MIDFTQYEHYAAPSNISEIGATCSFCGQPIVSGEIIVDINADEMGHEVCADASLEEAA